MGEFLRSDMMPPPSGNAGGWFGGLGDIFSWGGGATPPPTPPIQGFGGDNLGVESVNSLFHPDSQLPPPNIPQMPQIPQGSGTSTAWGGPPGPMATNAMEAPEMLQGSSPKKYSFMDNPGASDAMVAFGAAMLKAPSFNEGLGNAALAVNQVARENRPLGEVEYEKARQLAQLKRIGSGKGVTAGGASINRDILYRDDKGQTWFDAVGPNNEPGLYNQDTGQFTTGSVPGLSRDVYDYGSNRGRRDATKDADLEAEFSSKIPSIASTAAQFNELYKLASDDSSGIDSSFTTRVGRQLTTLSPEMGAYFTGLDPNNVTEFNNRIQKVALDYASGAFKGQGQVTENERLMIKNAVGEPGTMTKASAMKMFQVMRDAELRKLHMYREWNKSSELRESYGNKFGAYQADVITQATLDQIEEGDAPSPSGSPPSGSTNSGATKSGIKWSVDGP
jgi:hypothetical protein